MQASIEVVELAGGTDAAAINLEDTGGGCMAATLQLDEWVYVVGQDDYSVGRYSLAKWLGEIEQTEAPFIEADDAVQALELLNAVRSGAMVWQCGACFDGTRGWIHTSNRPRVGILACAACGREGGVDFRHADRHVGASDTEA